MTAPRPQTARAYSLVEIIVVISIIAILLALAGVGANSVINSRRVTATEMTMRTLETAIREFEKERPIEAREIATGIPYETWFEHLPPCPVTSWHRPPPAIGALPALYESDNSSTSYPATKVAVQFTDLIRRYFPPGTETRRWQLPNGALASMPPDATKDYASIECLVLFLTQCSPKAKAIIDKLPESCKDNQDKDQVVFPFGGPLIELIEIKDSWDKPLRWAVMPFNQNDPANIGLPVRWELRSAGKDGEFSPPFTPADRSDDVVWPKGSSR
jgi:prepilin-type N-terminal cleavage/methylation domain-containing protein